ncbi:hypothetical protein [Saccharibacillus brassicae]|uniref:DUF2178 domain-containing protein n=1 Tax=Saccharibacillus brassicae TaxID=2583377 RepID=A0A4Y6UYG1_SACBS|nr:hypothetical protein [Saccharibacillus brassicae]QDH22802.1 hypothetical protein FFV09_19290 [Saccharibacillus brassicae]
MNETLMQMAVPMNLGGLIGLFGGLLLALLGWAFGRHMQRKNRGLDERTDIITTRAKSFSWNVLIPALLICWVIITLFDGIGLPFFVIMALFVISQIAYVSSIVYHNGRN